VFGRDAFTLRKREDKVPYVNGGARTWPTSREVTLPHLIPRMSAR